MRGLVVGALVVLICGTARAQGFSTADTLQVAESVESYVLSVPVSRLSLTIPKDGLDRAPGGAPDHPRYFYFEDKALNLIVSGWFEPVELRGEQTLGYYFSLTDRSPPPEEYKYMTQGVAVTGELMIIFTILQREDNLAERTSALRMLANATHSK